MSLQLALKARFVTCPLSGVDRGDQEVTRGLLSLGDAVEVRAFAPKAPILAARRSSRILRRSAALTDSTVRCACVLVSHLEQRLGDE